jgi:hypothetical protein
LVGMDKRAPSFSAQVPVRTFRRIVGLRQAPRGS